MYVIYIYISWLTIVEGDLEALFSIAATPKYSKGSYTFSWIAPLTFDPYQQC